MAVSVTRPGTSKQRAAFRNRDGPLCLDASLVEHGEVTAIGAVAGSSAGVLVLNYAPGRREVGVRGLLFA